MVGRSGVRKSLFLGLFVARISFIHGGSATFGMRPMNTVGSPQQNAPQAQDKLVKHALLWSKTHTRQGVWVGSLYLGTCKKFVQLQQRNVLVVCSKAL